MVAKDIAESNVPQDPITQKSLLWPMFWCTILLLVSAAYSIVDEVYVRRPYKNYQIDGLPVVREALQDKMAASVKDLQRVRSSDAFITLTAQLKARELEAMDTIQALTDEMNKDILPSLSDIGEIVKVRRSLVMAATYTHDTSSGGDKKRARAELDRLYELNEGVPWRGETVQWNWLEMFGAFNNLKARQAQVQGKLATVNAPVALARKALKTYVDDNLRLPHPDMLQKLIGSLEDYNVEIKQIHLNGPDGEMVERCESCHIAIRFPVELTLQDVQGKRVYTSHPRPELLELHDPEVYGCTPCHGGNGIATDSVEKAHGYYKHWLHPLHARENMEAGCVQCHTTDYVIGEGKGFAERFNRGRYLFRWRGCDGCHKYEGFDRELALSDRLKKRMGDAELRVTEKTLELANLNRIAFETEDAPEDLVEDAIARISGVKEDLHLLRSDMTEAAVSYQDTLFDEKRIAPNLKEIKNKLDPTWIQSWIENPRAFRPDAKMPRFVVTGEEAWQIAAFLWQSAVVRDDIPAEVEGDSERGALLFRTRGCLGCHKMYDEEEEELYGDGFAATLSRVGEKTNARYLASWIKEPRKHNPRTTMPSLRLSDQDAQDIATYLSEQKSEDASYPARDESLEILENRDHFEPGKKLVKHFGCMTCHEVSGLENEGRIGTELSKEGSKPIERLDFGLLTHNAERTGWYTHKGFFEHKLEKPDVYDTGRYLPDRFGKLRMPQFWPDLADVEDEDEKAAIISDRHALVTFLLGSVEEGIPGRLRYDPQESDLAIRDGWWLIKKYNCDGCHQIVPNRRPGLWELPWYNEDPIPGVPGSKGRPPTLVGEGSRVDPDWLMRFLRNPSLIGDKAKQHGNGVRPGLMIRMPTYDLSAHERDVLVQFFVALSNLSSSYLRPLVEPLVGEELSTARAVFVAGDCYNCHLLGTETSINSDTTYAPTFVPVAERMRPSWYHAWITRPDTVIPKTAMPAILKLEQQADGTTLWRLDAGEISEGAKFRLTDREKKLLLEFPGDHADLLSRYFATWSEVEARFMDKKRATVKK